MSSLAVNLKCSISSDTYFIFFLSVFFPLKNSYKYTGKTGMLKLLGKLKKINFSSACQTMTM